MIGVQIELDKIVNQGLGEDAILYLEVRWKDSWLPLEKVVKLFGKGVIDKFHSGLGLGFPAKPKNDSPREVVKVDRTPVCEISDDRIFGDTPKSAPSIIYNFPTSPSSENGSEAECSTISGQSSTLPFSNDKTNTSTALSNISDCIPSAAIVASSLALKMTSIKNDSLSPVTFTTLKSDRPNSANRNISYTTPVFDINPTFCFINSLQQDQIRDYSPSSNECQTTTVQSQTFSSVTSLTDSRSKYGPPSSIVTSKCIITSSKPTTACGEKDDSIQSKTLKSNDLDDIKIIDDNTTGINTVQNVPYSISARINAIPKHMPLCGRSTTSSATIYGTSLPTTTYSSECVSRNADIDLNVESSVRMPALQHNNLERCLHNKIVERETDSDTGLPTLLHAESLSKMGFTLDSGSPCNDIVSPIPQVENRIGWMMDSNSKIAAGKQIQEFEKPVFTESTFLSTTSFQLHEERSETLPELNLDILKSINLDGEAVSNTSLESDGPSPIYRDITTLLDRLQYSPVECSRDKEASPSSTVSYALSDDVGDLQDVIGIDGEKHSDEKGSGDTTESIEVIQSKVHSESHQDRVDDISRSEKQDASSGPSQILSESVLLSKSNEKSKNVKEPLEIDSRNSSSTQYRRSRRKLRSTSENEVSAHAIVNNDTQKLNTENKSLKNADFPTRETRASSKQLRSTEGNRRHSLRSEVLKVAYRKSREKPPSKTNIQKPKSSPDKNAVRSKLNLKKKDDILSSLDSRISPNGKKKKSSIEEHTRMPEKSPKRRRGKAPSNHMITRIETTSTPLNSTPISKESPLFTPRPSRGILEVSDSTHLSQTNLCCLNSAEKDSKQCLFGEEPQVNVLIDFDSDKSCFHDPIDSSSENMNSSNEKDVTASDSASLTSSPNDVKKSFMEMKQVDISSKRLSSKSSHDYTHVSHDHPYSSDESIIDNACVNFDHPYISDAKPKGRKRKNSDNSQSENYETDKVRNRSKTSFVGGKIMVTGQTKPIDAIESIGIQDNQTTKNSETSEIDKMKVEGTRQCRNSEMSSSESIQIVAKEGEESIFASETRRTADGLKAQQFLTNLLDQKNKHLSRIRRGQESKFKDNVLELFQSANSHPLKTHKVDAERSGYLENSKAAISKLPTGDMKKQSLCSKSGEIVTDEVIHRPETTFADKSGLLSDKAQKPGTFLSIDDETDTLQKTPVVSGEEATNITRLRSSKLQKDRKKRTTSVSESDERSKKVVNKPVSTINSNKNSVCGKVEPDSSVSINTLREITKNPSEMVGDKEDDVEVSRCLRNSKALISKLPKYEKRTIPISKSNEQLAEVVDNLETIFGNNEVLSRDKESDNTTFVSIDAEGNMVDKTSEKNYEEKIDLEITRCSRNPKTFVSALLNDCKKQTTAISLFDELITDSGDDRQETTAVTNADILSGKLGPGTLEGKGTSIDITEKPSKMHSEEEMDVESSECFRSSKTIIQKVSKIHENKKTVVSESEECARDSGIEEKETIRSANMTLVSEEPKCDASLNMPSLSDEVVKREQETAFSDRKYLGNREQLKDPRVIVRKIPTRRKKKKTLILESEERVKDKFTANSESITSNIIDLMSDKSKFNTCGSMTSHINEVIEELGIGNANKKKEAVVNVQTKNSEEIISELPSCRKKRNTTALESKERVANKIEKRSEATDVEKANAVSNQELVTSVKEDLIMNVAGEQEVEVLKGTDKAEDISSMLTSEIEKKIVTTLESVESVTNEIAKKSEAAIEKKANSVGDQKENDTSVIENLAMSGSGEKKAELLDWAENSEEFVSKLSVGHEEQKATTLEQEKNIKSRDLEKLEDAVVIKKNSISIQGTTDTSVIEELKSSGVNEKEEAHERTETSGEVICKLPVGHNKKKATTLELEESVRNKLVNISEAAIMDKTNSVSDQMKTVTLAIDVLENNAVGEKKAEVPPNSVSKQMKTDTLAIDELEINAAGEKKAEVHDQAEKSEEIVSSLLSSIEKIFASTLESEESVTNKVVNKAEATDVKRAISVSNQEKSDNTSIIRELKLNDEHGKEAEVHEWTEKLRTEKIDSKFPRELKKKNARGLESEESVANEVVKMSEAADVSVSNQGKTVTSVIELKMGAADKKEEDVYQFAQKSKEIVSEQPISHENIKAATLESEKSITDKVAQQRSEAVDATETNSVSNQEKTDTSVCVGLQSDKVFEKTSDFEIGELIKNSERAISNEMGMEIKGNNKIPRKTLSADLMISQTYITNLFQQRNSRQTRRSAARQFESNVRTSKTRFGREFKNAKSFKNTSPRKSVDENIPLSTLSKQLKTDLCGYDSIQMDRTTSEPKFRKANPRELRQREKPCPKSRKKRKLAITDMPDDSLATSYPRSDGFSREDEYVLNETKQCEVRALSNNKEIRYLLISRRLTYLTYQ